ncbi:GNAT family N-acetyltransferase [Leclercia adecarboxylata]|uniref:GNAT family N-acetyltransferase n=1 Tax=Leclercia adecarboxylata TaxID=83655 RepID=UPI002DC0493C|nr:GNAT family N-acetyltransferase [Leclercia adecarboxylata]MEB6381541.1 GNAT family N-acetyltransferase [Leclercia adecarboxylata]
MDQGSIRVASYSDAHAVAQLHIASWRDVYNDVLDQDFLENHAQDERLSHWLTALAAPDENEVTFVMDTSDGLTGFVSIRLQDDPVRGACIAALHVSARTRGQGAGRALLLHAARWIADHDADSPVYLWVFEQNTRAARFYQSLGGSVAERTTSEIPSSHGAPVLRISWQNAQGLWPEERSDCPCRQSPFLVSVNLRGRNVKPGAVL